MISYVSAPGVINEGIVTGKVKFKITLLHVLKNGSIFLLTLTQRILRLLALGDVLDSQKDDPLLSRRAFNLPGIQKHYAPANVSKIVFNLIIIKGCLFGKDGFQQFPQLGDVPLFIAQVINKLSHGLFRVYLKDFIEGAAGGDYP